ncbi:sulfotransferase domain-containing protein [Pararhodobacter sp. SW119]|uniref:sulfotransferase domain-containing protein n=1 Tax=Pararhodobacter sp. SW119 TaxID=2780075 RepID=UPI001FD8095A|nr:sulfotransferase domain-containing protein [Pararhodobacter sp. SW119]
MSAELGNSYILIAGMGRSGSNRLLDILDTSRRTVCRNEVDEILGSSFGGIGATLFPEDFGPRQLAALQDAISGAALRRSARDRLDQTDKDYLTGTGRRVLPVLGKTRVRRLLGPLGLLDGQDEWRVPSPLLAESRLPDARLVLKLNGTPAWAAALAQADPGCRILHNIRAPAAYLQSWYNRFIRNGVGTASFEANFRDVPRILAHFGRHDADRLAEPVEANLVEVELWRWRYINESLQSLAAHSDRYLLLTYSEIEADLPGSAKRVFDFTELPLDPVEEIRIRSLKNVLFREPHKTSLDAALCDRLVCTVLEDSPLRSLI